MALSAGDFDYPLPEALIAQRPLARRDRSRLMVLRRGGQAKTKPAALLHHGFGDLPSLLRPGDLLALNDTRVLPARFYCRRATGGRIEALFLQEQAVGRWQVMLKGAGRCRKGEVLSIEGAEPAAALHLVDNLEEGFWAAQLRPAEEAEAVLQRVGRTPLPPYIRRTADEDDRPDRRRYQTVYAARPGAVAAPTAGLHFTEKVLADLADRGVRTCRITLHVGTGTFLPVRGEDLAQHKMHRERYQLSAEAAAALNATKRRGRRIVAVGTTTVRVLETLSAAGDPFSSTAGSTDLFIYPPWQFRAVDALITNFHLPRSTLLMLVAAFCRPGGTDGVGTILAAYEEAVRLRYRFYSYGDAMLIE